MISAFTGKYEFLSNFYERELTFDGIKYPTAEHAFQAQKTPRVELRRRIAEEPTPGKAKRAGRSLRLRDDWEDAKLRVMRDILAVKFSDRTLKAKLISTHPEDLIEGNHWGDTFWGATQISRFGMPIWEGPDYILYGHNHLGKLLMKLRDHLIDYG